MDLDEEIGGITSCYQLYLGCRLSPLLVIILQFLVLDVSHEVNCQVRIHLTLVLLGCQWAGGTKVLLGFDHHVYGKIFRYFGSAILVSNGCSDSRIPLVLVRIGFDCSAHVSSA